MCVSAPVSFAVGAALLPASVYCARIALRYSRPHLLLAVVPLAFAAQQFSEGSVWLGIEGQDPVLTQWASVVYLFFAMAFWPFWIPLSMLLVEQRTGVKWALAAAAVFSLAWGWLYLPIFLDPDYWLITRAVHHSVQYDVGYLPGYELAPRWLWKLGYLALVAVPIAVTTVHIDNKSGRVIAAVGLALLVIGFGVSSWLLAYAFASIWCFIAALLSLTLCSFFAKLQSPCAELLPAHASTYVTRQVRS